jgi:hypothetical protein
MHLDRTEEWFVLLFSRSAALKDYFVASHNGYYLV